jgi:hypothetical protein
MAALKRLAGMPNPNETGNDQHPGGQK